MKNLKSAIAFFLAIVIAFSCFGAMASAGTIKSIKIVQLPTKLTYYKDTDWKYGYWKFSPDNSNKGDFAADDSVICLTHNGGYYSNTSDIGMVDMTGLIVEVTYNSGSKKTVTYKETISGVNASANIYFSCPNGLSVGKNTVEIYLPEDYYAYTSFTITLVNATYKKGDVNGDGAVNSADALKVLRHAVGSAILTGEPLSLADVNKDRYVNSLDALEILKIAVGK